MWPVEKPEPIPNPEVVLVDSHNDGSNHGGVQENGGFHLFEVHISTVGATKGFFVLVTLQVLFCWLCRLGKIQVCYKACAIGCCGMENVAERHRRMQGVDAMEGVSPRDQGVGASAIVPVQVPRTQMQALQYFPRRFLKRIV